MTQMRFQHTTIFLWLGAALLILQCWAGLISEPSKFEVFDDVYYHHAFKCFDWGRVDFRIARKRYHVDKITTALQKSGTEGVHRLGAMIISDLAEVMRYGRLDIEETWDKLMVNSRFTRTSTKSKFSNPSDYEEKLHNLLHKWCNGSIVGGSRFSNYQHDWGVITAKQLDIHELEITQEIVSLAIDFHTFSMAWKSSMVFDSIAYSFVYSKITSQFTPCTHNMILRDIMENFLSKNLSNKDSYLKVIEILQIQYPHRAMPIIPKGSMSGNMQLLDDLIHVSQMIGEPLFDGEMFSGFWEILDAASTKNGFIFMEEFKELCFYFKKGRPFDNSVNFYNLLLKVGKSIDQKFQLEVATKLHSPLESGVKVSREIPQLGSILSEVKPHKSILFCNGQLMIHHVEELLRDWREGRLISDLTALPRARESQLIEIANLLCEHLVPVFTTNPAVTNYNLNVELEAQRFPILIQRIFLKLMAERHIPSESKKGRLSEITEDLEHEFRRKYITLKVKLANIRSAFKPETSSLEETKQKYSGEISDCLLECETQLMQPRETFLIMKNKKQWNFIKQKVFHSLEFISLRDAESLIYVLRKGSRLFKTVPLFNHLDYCMKIEDETEKTQIFKDIGKRLKSLDGSISKSESKGLNEVHQLNKTILEKKLSYETWEEQIIPKLFRLSTPAVQLLDEIVLDSAREKLLQDSRRISFAENRAYGAIDEEFLSEEAKKRFDQLSELWRIHDVDNRILTDQSIRW